MSYESLADKLSLIHNECLKKQAMSNYHHLDDESIACTFKTVELILLYDQAVNHTGELNELYSAAERYGIAAPTFFEPTIKIKLKPKPSN